MAKRESHTSLFKYLGFAVFAFGIVLLGLTMGNDQRVHAGGHDLSGLAEPGMVCIVMGLGLYFGRKWAALLFALITGAAGVWLCVGSVLGVPMPYMLFNISMGCGLLAPALMLGRYWSILKW